jgi:hypothetical protein
MTFLSPGLYQMDTDRMPMAGNPEYMEAMDRLMDRFWPLVWGGAIAALVAAGQSHLVLPIFVPVLLLGALVASVERN